MSTIDIQAPAKLVDQAPAIQHRTLWNKFTTFADRDAEHRTLWFLVSLIVQGVFFLPIPAVLIYYFGAPTLVVVVTLTLFFANVILGMGGASIRTLITYFAVSVLIHLAMLAIFII
jgi:hypothetical protein